MEKSEQVARRLLKVAGTTYAAEAGIRLSDKPMPLFQLLVLCMLASKPIDAKIAMGAAHELFKAGLRTSNAVLASDRRTMVSAFGRAHDGADIFLREVQDVWTWVRPHFDDRATRAAKRLGLPTEPAKLGALAPRANARLAAALVRASLDDDVRQRVAG